MARQESDYENHYQIDIRDLAAVESVLQNQYTVVLNFVGILNQYAEANPEEAVFINAYFPHFLAKQAAEFGHRLIHLSTDCVFSGSAGGYSENDFRDALGFYASTKAMGEVAYGEHLTCRTSIVGPELKENGIGLFHWFSQQQGEIKGYAHALWTGVTTIELAKAIRQFIESKTTGLYHLVNGSVISKLDLLKLFQAYYPKTRVEEVHPFAEYKTDKSLINTREDVDYQVASYETMVKEMMDWILEHTQFYPHY